MQYFLSYYTFFILLIYFLIRFKKPQFKNPMFVGSLIIFIGGYNILVLILVMGILAFLAFNLPINNLPEINLLKILFDMKFDILIFLIISLFSILFIQLGAKIIKSEKLNRYLE